MKRDNYILNLQVALRYSGRIPFLIEDMIGIDQSVPLGITCTFTLSMAGEYWTKDSTWLVATTHSIDAVLAKQPTYSFSSLGICTNLAGSPSPTFPLTMVRHSLIRSPLASQSPLMCPTITCGSQCMTTDMAPATLAMSRLRGPLRTLSHCWLLGIRGKLCTLLFLLLAIIVGHQLLRPVG